MLLTNGSIHLFIQSVSEQYNEILPHLHHRALLSSLLSSGPEEHSENHTPFNSAQAFNLRTCKIFILYWSGFSSCLFICLFLLYSISTIKRFTSLLQFAILKYLSKSIIVC